VNILKQYNAIFLLVIVLANAMQAPFIFVDFQLNREYIANNLCENREKPETACGGTCFLSKQLKDAHERDHQEEQPVTRNINFENLYLNKFQFALLSPPVMVKMVFTPYQILGSSAHLAPIFHPPRLV